MELSQITILESTTVWSGRGDLNARPPAPKADCGLPQKPPIFNAFWFNETRAAYCKLVELSGTLGFSHPQFHLHLRFFLQTSSASHQLSHHAF
jgi:hypothetical protein